MKERDSNIELLRLLCMVGIVLMHFIGLAVYPEVWNPNAPLSVSVIAGTLMCSVTILSVNIFGLISGYYGIQFSWKRLLILYLTCSLYAILGCGVGLCNGEDISIKSFYLFHQNEHVWMVIKDVLLQCECIKHGGGMAILAIMAIGLCVVALLFDKVRQFFIKFLIRK